MVVAISSIRCTKLMNKLNINTSNITQFIKQKAEELGFHSCGIASVRNLQEHEQPLLEWLRNGYHAEMAYMERNFEKRLNPSLLVEGTKSVVCFTLNYYPQNLPNQAHYQIAKYAFGKDYHVVIKNKIHALLADLQLLDNTIHGRAFVDSAPVLERAWAVEAGLGWIGKNSLLIVPRHGSFYFLAVLMLNVELQNDKPFTQNRCGSCTKCIDSCPTQAIVSDGVVDARKCISYLTIEKKGALTSGELSTSKFIFGCDICQDVCPWNRFSQPATESDFCIENELLQVSFDTITEADFKKLSKQSAMSRVSFSKIKNTIDIVGH